MFYKLTLLLALVLTVAGCSEHINADKSLSSSASEPYVLKRGEGEELFDATWIVKASSLSGTQGGELHWVATRSVPLLNRPGFTRLLGSNS